MEDEVVSSQEEEADVPGFPQNLFDEESRTVIQKTVEGRGEGGGERKNREIACRDFFFCDFFPLCLPLWDGWSRMMWKVLLVASHSSTAETSHPTPTTPGHPQRTPPIKNNPSDFTSRSRMAESKSLERKTSTSGSIIATKRQVRPGQKSGKR